LRCRALICDEDIVLPEIAVTKRDLCLVKCEKCDYENRASARHCGKCGSSLAQHPISSSTASNVSINQSVSSSSGVRYSGLRMPRLPIPSLKRNQRTHYSSVSKAPPKIFLLTLRLTIGVIGAAGMLIGLAFWGNVLGGDLGSFPFGLFFFVLGALGIRYAWVGRLLPRRSSTQPSTTGVSSETLRNPRTVCYACGTPVRFLSLTGWQCPKCGRFGSTNHSV
jgi:hypothetical protein